MIKTESVAAHGSVCLHEPETIQAPLIFRQSKEDDSNEKVSDVVYG